jgi:hypothetical protein
MGVYLSKPVTQKETEQHEDERFIIGASAMQVRNRESRGRCLIQHLTVLSMRALQGWRQSMEDAHVVSLNILPNAAFFAVFDGHGGMFFCKTIQLFMASVLTLNVTALQGRKSRSTALHIWPKSWYHTSTLRPTLRWL